NKDLLCIGTSATMVSGGTREEEQKTVAEIASKIFGVTVSSSNVIDEKLKRSIQYDGHITTELLQQAVVNDTAGTYAEFIKSPFSAWIEETFGIEKHDGFYKRKRPITFKQGAEKLCNVTGLDQSACEEAIGRMLLKGSQLKHDEGSSVFALRIHQFISQGDSVYATFEQSDKRRLTLSGQRWTESEEGQDRLLAPLVFCRICGQEYYQVSRNRDDKTFQPRLPHETSNGEDNTSVDGYLLIDENEKNPIWSKDREEELPETWFRQTKKGPKVERDYEAHIPEPVYVAPDGTYTKEKCEDHIAAWFLSVPFLTCLSCGAVYDKRKREFAKLSRLSSEGRSTATTLLTQSIVRQMQKDRAVPLEARKILSFTDNRQDASLQAGHFNDFILTGMLRSAIYRALPDSGWLDHTNTATQVVEALNLPQSAYAINSGEFGHLERRNREAFTAYIEYRIYQDLQRGWKIVQPNLEQCGMLKIEYDGLREVCSDNIRWQGNEILFNALPENKFKAAKAFLDHMRRSLAIDANCLDSSQHMPLQKKVNQTLKEPWTFDDDEQLAEGKWFAYGNRHAGELSLSPISVIGKFLRSSRAWPNLTSCLDKEEYEQLLRKFVNVLNQAGFILFEPDKDNFRIQLHANSMLWTKGDGAVESDIVRGLRLKSASEEVQRANPFFFEFYKEEANKLSHLEAREHTGQTSREDREDREKRFKDGDLSTLFCSPTMELGIDIADLNAVNMRNVPPTPANYAQRSGRAGRSGQPAFITTYCSTGSGHDQYFFNRQADMVAGVVAPPRLDLANEDMLTSHMHAVWLAT
ncbi:MAG TPA: helicase-related protein, partial [Thermodesulfovibrionia bacterium]|nr:helicase-related protein [Thermodesulfovibrionia bacterium]